MDVLFAIVKPFLSQKMKQRVSLCSLLHLSLSVRVCACVCVHVLL